MTVQRRAKLKRLTNDDRERMMRSRALPEDFNFTQSLQSTYEEPTPSMGLTTASNECNASHGSERTVSKSSQTQLATLKAIDTVSSYNDPILGSPEDSFSNLAPGLSFHQASQYTNTFYSELVPPKPHSDNLLDGSAYITSGSDRYYQGQMIEQQTSNTAYADSTSPSEETNPRFLGNQFAYGVVSQKASLPPTFNQGVHDGLSRLPSPSLVSYDSGLPLSPATRSTGPPHRVRGDDTGAWPIPQEQRYLEEPVLSPHNLQTTHRLPAASGFYHGLQANMYRPSMQDQPAFHNEIPWQPTVVDDRSHARARKETFPAHFNHQQQARDRQRH